MRHARLLLVLAPLALAACGGGGEPAPGNDLAALDRELTQANVTAAADPALRSALQDQIMVDPALTQQANADVIRPPAQPRSGGVPVAAAPVAASVEAKVGQLRSAPAPTPGCPQCAAARRALTLGALAGAQGGGRCAANVAYSAQWANRLPGAVPLYPDAQVVEAAGADGAGCRLRVVTFTSAASVQRLLDFYYTRTSAGGFTAQHRAEGDEHVIAGTKAGGAFLAIVRPRAGGGSEVDLMADGA
jgi:hypothetical protein